jgi:site-specific recombinase XerD
MSKKTVTIMDAAARYIEYLRAAGKSERTIYTYGEDLRLAIEHFGEDKDVAKIIPAQVAGFFKSDAMNKVPKSGREKSIITITKTRRVFRQMLVFCKEQGWIATVPLTKDELAKVREPKEAEAAPKAKRGKKAEAAEKPARKPRAKKATVPAEPPAETPAAEAAAE